MMVMVASWLESGDDGIGDDEDGECSDVMMTIMTEV